MSKREEQLFAAAENNELNTVKKLLRKFLFFKCVNVNCRNHFGSTPLHIAAIHGNIEVCTYLIISGAELNAADSDGRTPLHYAARNGSVHICRKILQNKADVNIKDSWGNTPISFALAGGHQDLIKMLLNQGADPDADYPEAAYPGTTLLHQAVKTSSPQIVALLLASGASVNKTDSVGKTVLDYARSSSREVQELLRIHVGQNKIENA